MSGHLIRWGTIVLVSSQRMSCWALLECELIFVLESILWIPANEKRVDELFWRIEFHSSPSFRGPPPPHRHLFPFSRFRPFCFPCPHFLAGSAWVSTVGGVAYSGVRTSEVRSLINVVDSYTRKQRNTSALRSLRVQHWHFQNLTREIFLNPTRRRLRGQ